MSSVRGTFFVAKLFANRRHDVIYDALTISLRCPTMSYDALRVEPAREKQVEEPSEWNRPEKRKFEEPSEWNRPEKRKFELGLEIRVGCGMGG